LLLVIIVVVVVVVVVVATAAAAFVVDLVMFKSFPEYKILFTGHSLGAAQAEYTAVRHNKEAVTFESPGISSILKKLYVELFGLRNFNFLLIGISTAIAIRARM
jgi:hypothetical protein